MSVHSNMTTIQCTSYDPTKPIIPGTWYTAEVQGEFAKSHCLSCLDTVFSIDANNAHDKCAIRVSQYNKGRQLIPRGFMPTNKALYNKPNSLFTYMKYNPNGNITVRLNTDDGKTVIDFMCAHPNQLPESLIWVEADRSPKAVAPPVPFNPKPMHYAVTYALIQDDDVAEAFMMQWMQDAQQPAPVIPTKVKPTEQFPGSDIKGGMADALRKLKERKAQGICQQTFHINDVFNIQIAHDWNDLNDFPIEILSIIVVNRLTGIGTSVHSSEFDIIHKRNYTMVRPKGSDVVSGWRYNAGDDAVIKINYRPKKLKETT